MFIIEAVGLAFLGAITVWLLHRNLSRPSHDRAWVPFHKELPYGEYAPDGTILVHNIRRARYRTEFDYNVSYHGGLYDPQTLKRVWFCVAPYKTGQAHTFLSFEFNDGRYLAVSVEVRKTHAESFKAWMVALWNYEIFYILADEQDILWLRTNIWKGNVMLYPTHLPRIAAQKVFASVVEGVNDFYKKPRFYRVLYRNCTSVPMNHLRAGAPTLPKFDFRYIATSEADRVLYAHNLIDTDTPLADARKRYNVTSKAQSLACDETFSKRVREGIMPR